jgi:hypothetical protein
MKDTGVTEFEINRPGAPVNRADSLEGIKPSSQFDRDEWPMAMFRQGGKGASVKYVDRGNNRGLGAWIAARLRGLANGATVRFEWDDPN